MFPPSLALLLWPVVIIILFQRQNVQVAAAVSVILGFLLLPTISGWDFPLLPALDKETIPGIMVVVMVMATASRRQAVMAFGLPKRGYFSDLQMDVLPGWLPGSLIGRILLAMIVLGAFGTVMTNGDPVPTALRALKGLEPYDAFNVILSLLSVMLPFFIARKLLASPNAHFVLLTVLVVVGLGYSLLVLFEVRMSPRLNLMLYGFHPKSWVQALRGGGFRPMVFLENGLILAMFTGCMCLGAFALMRHHVGALKTRFMLAGGWMLMTIFLSNSLGALMITVAFLPVVLFLRVGQQLMFAAAIAGAVLTYPLLRSSNLIPIYSTLNFVESIDERRVGSLRFRFENEDILLARAQQRPIFGWGGWNRSRIYDEKGRDVSVTDGRWIIVIGQGGWVRYIGEFGLLTLPIIILALRRKRFAPSYATSGLCLVLAANLVDSIPNGGVHTLTWLIAGALMGRLELVAKAEEAGTEDNGMVPIDRGGRSPGYSQPPPPLAATTSGSGQQVYSRVPPRAVPDRTPNARKRRT